MTELTHLDQLTELRVLGIDPSWTATGVAHCDGTTETAKYPKGTEGDHRLLYLYDWVYMNAQNERPTHVVIEDLVANPRAPGAVAMPQAAVRIALMAAGLSYLAIPPATLKKFATGNGGANKHDMGMELFKRAGLDIRDDNQVDAWWLREVGLHLLGQPTITLPQTHLAALGKVKAWR